MDWVGKRKWRRLHCRGYREGSLENDFVRIASTGLWNHSGPRLLVNCLLSDSVQVVGWWFCLETGTNCWQIFDGPGLVE